MPLILTINSEAVPFNPCIDRTDDTYWDPESGCTSWDGSQWNTDCGTNNSLFASGSPSWTNDISIYDRARITFTNEPTTRDWRFRLRTDDFNTVGDTGTISDPGAGTFTVTFLLDHGQGVIHQLEITNPSGHVNSGSIDKIEFCPSSVGSPTSPSGPPPA